jgi:16S rRNA processing protein RimM
MIQMTVYTDFPERLQPDVWVYAGEQHKPLRIASVRWHREALLIAFEGVNSREAAEELRSELVFVTTDDRPPLPEGEYYHHQLLGLQVKTVEGQLLGVLQEILETGANDVYVIDRPEGGELLLPAIESVVQEVDLDQRVMIVRLLEGLMPGE